MATCRKCGLEKTHRQPCGRLVCKPCVNDYERKHYRSNVPTMRTRKREWMAKQRQTEPGRRRQNENQRRCRINGGAAKQKALFRRYRETRLFYWRSRLFNAHYKTHHTAQDLAGLWRQQRGHCALTNLKLTAANCQLDHRLPIARGGSHELENLRWTIAIANQAKRDLTDAEFLELCRWVVVCQSSSGLEIESSSLDR